MTIPREPSSAALLLGDGWASPNSGLRVSAFEEIVCAEQIEDVLPALAKLQERLHDGYCAIGYLAYEAAAAWGLRAYPQSSDFPLIWFGLTREERLTPLEEIPSDEKDGALLVDALPLMEEGAYREKIAAIRKLIAAGDTYQVNYTVRARLTYDQAPLSFFLRLYRNQPVPYAAWLDLGDDRRILSLSPELFLRREGDRIESRPMKGTTARGRYPAEDEALAEALRSSAKERAENIMIVDMMRNDLGRVCQYGSVHAETLLHVERYRTVHQMTSTVSGLLRPSASLADILAATFPAASVTGAPKPRTMEIIHELEDEPRGVYCGAIGLIRPNGEFIFNVAIRTLEGQGSGYRLGVGGGIVWDALPEMEYRELRSKALFVSRSWPQFELIETIRLDPDGVFTYLDGHLHRMEASARYWGYPFSRQALLNELHRYAESLAERPTAVRVTMNQCGEFSLSYRPITPVPECVRVRFSPESVDSNDCFLFHKTTHRERYNRQRTRDLEEGYFETLFVNELGHVTEGCITTIAWRNGGAWFTPPLEDGLLPGVWRAAFIRDNRAQERSVTVEELMKADEALLGNSVIGAVRVDRLEAMDREACWLSTSYAAQGS